MRRIRIRARVVLSPLLVGCVLAACAGTTPSGSPSALGSSSSVQAAEPIVINVVRSSAGYSLAGANGLTLYLLTKDVDGTSTCTTGLCAERWIALKGDAAQLTVGEGVSGTFGTTTWADGTKQITHNGQPLYYFRDDAYMGEANGQGRGGVWCVAPVAYSTCGELTTPAESAAPTFDAPGPADRASASSRGEY